MTPPAEDSLLSVAASISDGGRIDWHQLGAAADDPKIVEQLRVICLFEIKKVSGRKHKARE